jgi:putative salt-induced outer membrane protein
MGGPASRCYPFAPCGAGRAFRRVSDMMRTPNLRVFLIAVATFVLNVAPASAQWSGRGELGLVIASGNNETKTGNAKLAVKYTSDAWTHEAGLAAVYAADEVGSTAQRWEGTEQSDYRFNPRNFWFGGVRYENDHFSGFRYQGTASTGVGHLFIESPVTKLKAQIGAGYKFFETRDEFSPAGVLLEPGETGDSIAGIASADFEHAFNASTSLKNEFTAEYTSENTFLQNELSLQVKMTDQLAVAIGYTVRYNTDPPPSFAKTDTLTTVNLVYEVK